MELKRLTIGRIVVFGLLIAGIALVAFTSTNAGVASKHSPDDFGGDPYLAPSVIFGILLAAHAVAIAAMAIASGDDHPDRAEAFPHTSRQPKSVTRFVRAPLPRVLLVGPIWAICALVALFIGHTYAADPGVPGSVWGDLAGNPLSALSIVFLCSATANTSFAWSSLAEAFSRDRRPVSLTILTCGLGLGCLTAGLFGYFGLVTLPTIIAFPLGVVCLILSTVLLIPLRWWAIRRVDRFDSGERQPAGSRRGFGRTPQPPEDALQPGERILTSYLGETPSSRANSSTADQQMLVLTDRRIFRASIIAPGRTFVLEQAEPGQLSGGSSERHSNHVITTVLFNGRQPMNVTGGTAEASGHFADAITVLARTGRLPR
ncbi:hypothetical protein [Brevibacterium sediminis]|uniref:hypothetical protein n=1 Tax=Brevibacterium sediminis TaxID=1857024 RepID=UPI003B3B190A